MPDWDADSPSLRQNLTRVLRTLRDQATLRRRPEAGDAKLWHAEIMKGLALPQHEYAGRFRGETGLEDIEVRIGYHQAVSPEKVADEIAKFESKLQQLLARLDERIPAGGVPTSDTLDAVLDVCGWVHSEWVRIHPFVNGNGRTARLWANYVSMRYGLLPFVCLRPRPEGKAYASAGSKAMVGDWQPTADLFRVMLVGFLDDLKQ